MCEKGDEIKQAGRRKDYLPQYWPCELKGGQEAGRAAPWSSLKVMVRKGESERGAERRERGERGMEREVGHGEKGYIRVTS